MFGLIKTRFIAVTGLIGLNARLNSNLNPLNVISLKSVSMSNQKCKVRPAIINVNSNEPLF